MKHTKIPYRGYTIVSEGLENVLGNLGKYAESMQQDKMSIEVLMNDTCIDPLDYPLYDLCWCLYQLDDRKMEDEKKRLPQKNSLLFCHKTTNHLPLTFKYLSIRSSWNFTIPLL